MDKDYCNHCGKCCTDVLTQISLTIGDLIRISNYLNKPISSFFPDQMNFNPFRTNKEGIYEYELAINVPCPFYDISKEKDKCIIYNVRTLNCRFFPIWLIKAPEKAIDPYYPCVKRIRKIGNRFIKYGKALSKILMEEEKFTEKIINKIGAKKTIDIRNNEEYKKIINEKIPSRTKEVKKMELCIKLRDNNFFSKFPKMIEDEANNKEILKKIEENNKLLEEIEKFQNEFLE